MSILLSLLIFILFIFNLRGNRFSSLFVCLSLFYLFVFFALPFLIFEFSPTVSYQGWSFSSDDDLIYRAFWSAVIFLAGFFCISIFRLITTKCSSAGTNERLEANFFIHWRGGNAFIYQRRVLIIFFILVSLYFLPSIFDGTRAAEQYLVRTGEADSNIVDFFVSIFFSAMLISCVFVSVSRGHKTLSFLFIIVWVVSVFTSSSSRNSVLILFSFLFLLLSRMKPKHFLAICIFGVFAFLPILLNGKKIIREIVVNKNVPDIISLYGGEFEAVLFLKNFAHPFFSLLNIDSLLSILGYRYFYDFLHGFLFYLRVFGLDFGDSLTYYNTEVFRGVRESIVPTGYLAFGYMQLSYAGVFVAGLFYRFVGYLSERLFRVYKTSSAPIKFYLANVAAYTFYIGEVRALILVFFIPMAMVYLFSIITMRPIKLQSNSEYLGSGKT